VLCCAARFVQVSHRRQDRARSRRLRQGQPAVCRRRLFPLKDFFTKITRRLRL